MSHSRMSRIIALDGGTTNTRARLIVDGKVVASARRSVGVRDNVLDEVRPLLRSVRECLDELRTGFTEPIERIVAAGMLSSEVGLVSVPHVLAPAGLQELAHAAAEIILPELDPAPILVIPGIKTPPGQGLDGWAESDLMRGEEVETLGAIEALGLSNESVAFLWPGSHTKLVAVDAARKITSSFTTLAGEITSTVACQTLIAKSLPRNLPDEPDPDAVAMGARLVARYGLGRASFLVRIADVTNALDEHRRASFWVGAVIADDASQLAKHPILQHSSRLLIGGREPQRSIYCDCLKALLPIQINVLEDSIATSASAIGALAIARLRP